MKAGWVSAVVLAGGRSRRMGRDKAGVLDPVSGRSLLDLQLAKLRSLAPLELMVSRQAGQVVNLPEEVRVVEDAVPDRGPLAGLVACLTAARGEWLLVLAVDLPRMEEAYLERLMEACCAGGRIQGAVPKREGRWEPLAAVYPVDLAGMAAERLARGELAMQGFVNEAWEAGRVAEVRVSRDEEVLFRNANAPGDLA